MLYFGRHAFETKKQVQNRLQRIRSQPEGGIQDALDVDLLTQMLAKHPAADTYYATLGDIAGFSLRVAKTGPYAPTQQFFVHGANGRQSSVSFKPCLDSKKTYDHDNYMSAMRSEVRSQIEAFYRTHLMPHVCPRCKKEVSKCEVDHERFFSDLVKAFEQRLAQLEKRPSAIAGMGADAARIGSPYDPSDKTSLWLKDRDQALEWQEFHQTHATLRYACVPCNRKRKPPRVSSHV
jgi:hypothetical protein